MLPNSKTHNNTRGFTLVELLVAMAIFITLMGSLVALFSGTVDTTRAGYTRLAAFEQGRVIVEVLKRDLNSVFTARDSGETQQFYGQKNGFAFVGGNEDGQLSRITYGVVRADDSKDFLGDFSEELGVLLLRAMTQGATYGAASDPLLPPSFVTGVILAQNLVSLLATLELPNFRLGTPLLVWTDLQNMKQDYINTGILPNLTGDFLPNTDEQLLLEDFQAVYQMAQLVRFEEFGQPNLEAFILPGNNAYTAAWPKISPSTLGLDTYDTTAPADEYDTSNYSLYNMELAAITMAASPSLDMRGLVGLANYITPDVLDNMLRANRRKIWIDMLTNNFSLDYRYAKFNFWQSKELLLYPNIYDTLLDPFDYAIADDFTLRAIVRDSDTTFIQDIGISRQIIAQDNRFGDTNGDGVGEGHPIDLMGTPAFFSFAQGKANADGNFLAAFNANENIAGYDKYVRYGYDDPSDTRQGWEEFDAILQDQYTGFKSASGLQGSPLEARIPSMIKVQFWVARPGVGVSAPPIKHWFSEVVDVPSGMTRKAPSSITASAGY